MTRSGGASNAIDVAAAVAAGQVAGHFAASRNVDADALSNEGVDAGLRVGRIDILIIAEKRAARSFALAATAAFEFGVALNVAIHVDVRGARAGTAGVAMLGAARRLDLTLAATVAGTAGLSVGRTIALRVFGLTIRDKRLLALGVATSDAIEFGRVTLRDAADAAVVRARCVGGQGTTTGATRLELDGLAFDVASAFHDDATIGQGAAVGHELAALGGHVER